MVDFAVYSIQRVLILQAFTSNHKLFLGPLAIRSGQIKDQIRKENEDNKLELFVAFGPHDNLVRIDIDDYCIVNDLASFRGINSQQIHCTYRLWKSKANSIVKPFCCLTQVKIQNYLALCGEMEIEEAISQLLKDKLENCIDETIETELFGSLGWDEFYIFTRSSRGFESAFKPVYKSIRNMTLSDLKNYLKTRNVEIRPENDNIKLDRKHLFLSTYSIPSYSIKLSEYMEDVVKNQRSELLHSDLQILKRKDIDTSDMERKMGLHESFGLDKISVSTRLSIKPGHLEDILKIMHHVFEDFELDSPEIFQFSIGRYDLYPWLGKEMTSKEFVILYELLRFAISGNLPRKADYKSYLKKTQFYNSFTIISCIDETGSKSNPNIDLESEGGFISQMEKLCLSETNGKSIEEQFKSREILAENVPKSIIIGLSRIFALFDSSIRDRFTCDSFIDLYPFMFRIKEIIQTVHKDPNGHLSIKIKDGQNELDILLPESRESIAAHPLVKLFHEAIRLFYRGFSHRYLSSYPMMDKNEICVDFSGRLHRILSALTGMQNLLLEDLNCISKKGFNVISTYPNIRIHRSSFNVSEANVFHLLQIETFCVLFHEVMHSVAYSNKMDFLKKILYLIEEKTPEKFSSNSFKNIGLLLQEILGDLALLQNGFSGNMEVFDFWFWLLIEHNVKALDSNILLRYLLLNMMKDQKTETFMLDEIGRTSHNYIKIQDLNTFASTIIYIISAKDWPDFLKQSIIRKVKIYLNQDDNSKELYKLAQSLMIVYPVLRSLLPLVENQLKTLFYADTEAKVGEKLLNELPLFPKTVLKNNNQKRQQSSISIFRTVLSFIYDQRHSLLENTDAIINFNNRRRDLRITLFKLRIALINTLHWEALVWKKTILQEKNVKSSIHFEKKSDK